jgi:hypothetical protein
MLPCLRRIGVIEGLRVNLDLDISLKNVLLAYSRSKREDYVWGVLVERALSLSQSVELQQNRWLLKQSV